MKDFPEKLSKYVKDWFVKHNVDVVANSNITRVEPGKIFNHDDEILLDAVVWTAGVQPVKIVRDMDVEKDKHDRPLVTQYFNLLDDEHVYVVGDCASSDLAPTAQLAEEQAEQIVKVLRMRWKVNIYQRRCQILN